MILYFLIICYFNYDVGKSPFMVATNNMLPWYFRHFTEEKDDDFENKLIVHKICRKLFSYDRKHIKNGTTHLQKHVERHIAEGELQPNKQESADIDTQMSRS